MRQKLLRRLHNKLLCALGGQVKARLGYIVTAKPDLIESLKSNGNQLHEYFSTNYILATEECDYEDAFEGWEKSIKDCAKNTFIIETVLGLDFDKTEMESIFGKYNSNIELFDKWWSLQNADCDIIPITWLGT